MLVAGLSAAASGARSNTHSTFAPRYIAVLQQLHARATAAAEASARKSVEPRPELVSPADRVLVYAAWSMQPPASHAAATATHTSLRA